MSAVQIQKILTVTDSLSVHREAVFIPLRTEGDGSVNLLPDGSLRLVVPSDIPFDAWLEDLRRKLQKMDLLKVRRK